MRIDFLGLEAFLAIADRGSFHRAAAYLNLSQTALSHRMRKLEEDLGVKLLTRTTRQVTLTPAGLELLPKARQVIEDMALSLDELRRRNRDKQEHLAICCLPTIAIRYMPGLMSAFSALYPEVSVRIFDNSASEISDLVQSGTAEFGLTIVSANRWDLDLKPLQKEPYVLACHRDHPLAKHKAVNWSALDGEPLVRISTRTGNRVLIDDALGSRRETLDWRYEVQHGATAVSLAAGGAALAIVPRMAVDVATMPELAVVELRNPAVTRIIGIVTKRGMPLSPAGEALQKLIERHMREQAS